MVLRLKRTILFILLSSTMLLMHTAAAENNRDAIRHAWALQVHGDYAASVAILAPLADSPPADLSAMEKGTVWDLLGSAYETLDNFARSRHCFEQAIAVFQGAAPASPRLASAVDDLGSLEELAGNVRESEHLRKRAIKMYAALKDDAGVARASTNLAAVAAFRGDRSAARHYLDQALRYSQHARGFDDDDSASLMSIQAWFALQQRDSRSALAFSQAAIEHWTRLHGAGSCQVATGLMLRGQAWDEGGDYLHAFADLEEAEDIFAAKLGTGSTLYWRAVLCQALLMKHDGRGREAQTLEKSARNALRAIASKTCANCSVSVEAFR